MFFGYLKRSVKWLIFTAIMIVFVSCGKNETKTDIDRLFESNNSSIGETFDENEQPLIVPLTLSYEELFVFSDDVFIAEVALDPDSVTDQGGSTKPANNNYILKVLASLKGKQSEGKVSQLRINDLNVVFGKYFSLSDNPSNQKNEDLLGKQYLIFDGLNHELETTFKDYLSKRTIQYPYALEICADEQNQDDRDLIDYFYNRNRYTDNSKINYGKEFDDKSYQVFFNLLFGCKNIGSYSYSFLPSGMSEKIRFDGRLEDCRTVFLGTVVSQERVEYTIRSESDLKDSAEKAIMYKIKAKVNCTLISRDSPITKDEIEFLSPCDIYTWIDLFRDDYPLLKDKLNKEETDFISDYYHELPIMMIDYDYSPYLDGVS